MTDTAAVEVDAVTKVFGSVPALRGISMEVRQGEVFALLGPNGAGKTTLIRILLDMIRPDSGTVRIFGQAFSEELRRRIGYLPEERGLYLKRRVSDVLEYFGELKGMSRGRARVQAAEWLDRLKLTEYRTRRVAELSKGNQQKVQLAATLVAEPDIAVLDEPFSGLDPVSVRLVSAVITELREAGRTIILSSHQMAAVEALCDRVMMVNRGRRVVYGSVESVRAEHSEHAVLLKTSGCLNRFQGVANVGKASEGRVLVTLSPGTEPKGFLREIVLAGLEVDSFQTMTSHLDDIFVKVVQAGE